MRYKNFSTNAQHTDGRENGNRSKEKAFTGRFICVLWLIMSALFITPVSAQTPTPTPVYGTPTLSASPGPNPGQLTLHIGFPNGSPAVRIFQSSDGVTFGEIRFVDNDDPVTLSVSPGIHYFYVQETGAGNKSPTIEATRAPYGTPTLSASPGPNPGEITLEIDVPAGSQWVNLYHKPPNSEIFHNLRRFFTSQSFTLRAPSGINHFYAQESGDGNVSPTIEAMRGPYGTPPLSASPGPNPGEITLDIGVPAGSQWVNLYHKPPNSEIFHNLRRFSTSQSFTLRTPSGINHFYAQESGDGNVSPTIEAERAPYGTPALSGHEGPFAGHITLDIGFPKGSPWVILYQSGDGVSFYERTRVSASATITSGSA